MVGKNDVNVKAIDHFWDNWFESVKRFNDLQNEFEKEAFKTFNHFEQLFKPTNELLEKTKEKSMTITKQTNDQLRKSIESFIKITNQSIDESSLNEVEQMSKQIQNLFWTSNKALFDFITTSQDEAIAMINSIMNEQRKEREATLKKLKNLIDEIKEKQTLTTRVK